MDHPDQFYRAYAVFLREAGARLHEFMDVEVPERRPSHVPPEVLEDATRTIITLVHEDGDGPEVDASNPKHVAEVQRMLYWLEEQAGRPMDLSKGA